MNEHHIYIYGDIFNEQSDYASDYGIVSLSDVVKQIQNAGDDVELFVVHIHSRGGDVNEGFAIHDVLVNTGKEIRTIIEGLCASIATVPAMAGSERQMLENSEFMIHNPIGGMFGDAEEMEKYAERLREAQDKIIDFYVEKTGTERDKIAKLVEEETFMTAEEAKDLGFITEVVETIKAVAILDSINNKNNRKMEEELKGIKKLLADLKALFDNDGKEKKVDKTEPQNLTLETSDGVKLVFDTEKPQPAVGDKVTCEGEDLSDASYIMPEGETINIKEGVVESIVPKEEEAPVNESEEITQLKETIQGLETTIADLKAKDDTYKESLKEIKEQINLIAGNVTSKEAPPKDTSFREPHVSFSETEIKDENESVGSKAIEQRKQRREKVNA